MLKSCHIDVLLLLQQQKPNQFSTSSGRAAKKKKNAQEEAQPSEILQLLVIRQLKFYAKCQSFLSAPEISLLITPT